MKRPVNSYGKTWHRAARRGTESGDGVPLGPATLMWSFNRDGERDERLKQDLDETMDLDTAGKREQRSDLADLVHPQHRVDAMAVSSPAPVPSPGWCRRDGFRAGAPVLPGHAGRRGAPPGVSVTTVTAWHSRTPTGTVRAPRPSPRWSRRIWIT